MAFLGVLATIGTALVSAAPTIATLASAGLGLASSLGAFSGGGKSSKSGGIAYVGTSEVKDTTKEAAEAEEKKRKAFLATLAGGRGSTILTSGKGLGGEPVVGAGLKAQLGA